MSVLTASLLRVPLCKHVNIGCFWRLAPALVVPCIPMPVATSVSECLADNVLPGKCPSVMTFGEPTMNGGFLDQGGLASKVLRSKMYQLSFGTSVRPVQIPNVPR